MFAGLGRLFKDKRENCKTAILEEVKFLLHGIATGAKNISTLCGSARLGSLMRLHKSVVFEGLLNREDLNWRQFLLKVTTNLTKMTAKEIARKADEAFTSESTPTLLNDNGRCKLPECLIADDTVYPKSGRRPELPGKVFDHNLNKSVLGYKGLNICGFDGRSTYVIDFALVGEEMDDKDHPQGMKPQDIEKRFSVKRNDGSEAQKRIDEYSKTKPELLRQMVRNARKNGFDDAEYLLCDTWFFSKDVLAFTEDEMKMHYLGMAKSSICFDVEGKKMNADGLGKYMKAKEAQRRKSHGKDAEGNPIPKLIKKLYGTRFYGAELVCKYKGRTLKVCIFSTNKKDWNVIVSTNTALTLKEAFEYYQIRWTIEVFHSDAKSLYGLGKCQQRNFAGQIADMTLKMAVFNIMTFIKRITVYETLGGLFKEMTECSAEVDLADRIWGMIMETLASVAKMFDSSYDAILETVLGENKDINVLYRLVAKTEPRHHLTLVTSIFT